MVASVLALVSLLGAATPIEGRYRSPDGKRTIRVDCAGARCQGVLVASTEDPANVGKVVLRDLEPAGAAWKGTAVLPRRGKEVAVELSRPDSATLRMRAGGGLLGATRDWVRLR